MKAKQLFEKLIENWQVKAVCFVIAIFLYIFNQQSGMETKIIKMKVTVENESGFRPAAVFNPDVSVSVRGVENSINSLDAKNFTAYLDFSYVAKSGEYEFPVLLNLDQTASSVSPLEVKVTPEKIKVKVEEEIAGFAKIEPLLKGDVQHGYKVESVAIEPEQVKIRGARSLVENCGSLQTENIVLSNAKTSFSGTAKIENPKKNISLESDSVSYTVKIVEIQDSRTLENIPVTLDSLAENLEPEKKIENISLPVAGSLLNLEAFTNYSSVCHADCSGIQEPGTFVVPLRYYLPYGVRLGENYPKSVSLTVAEKKNPDTEKITESDDLMERIGNGIDGE